MCIPDTLWSSCIWVAGSEAGIASKGEGHYSRMQKETEKKLHVIQGYEKSDLEEVSDLSDLFFTPLFCFSTLSSKTKQNKTRKETKPKHHPPR